MKWFLLQESLLNGRIEPVGVVEGFTADIGASGDFCPKHIQADVTAYFFSLSDDNAPSPYLVSPAVCESETVVLLLSFHQRVLHDVVVKYRALWAHGVLLARYAMHDIEM